MLYYLRSQLAASPKTWLSESEIAEHFAKSVFSHLDSSLIASDVAEHFAKSFSDLSVSDASLKACRVVPESFYFRIWDGLVELEHACCVVRRVVPDTETVVYQALSKHDAALHRIGARPWSRLHR
ncbi:MAG: hypothetical protein R3B09_26950 [Nannocystaceae bacterium]